MSTYLGDINAVAMWTLWKWIHIATLFFHVGFSALRRLALSSAFSR